MQSDINGVRLDNAEIENNVNSAKSDNKVTQVPKSTVHYHVMAGFHGCLPEENTTYRTKSDARQGLKSVVSDLRDGGNRLRGSLKSGYFEITKKTDALCDYAEIGECTESECLKELDE